MLHGPRGVLAAASAIVVVIVAAFIAVSQVNNGAPTASAAREEPVTTGLRRISVDDRGAPITLAGSTLDGSRLDVADWRGRVVVVNIWDSWCGPCRAESRDLMKVYTDTRGEDVEFVGIDVRDQRESALAFVREFGITYPSFFDDDSALLLSLSGTVPVAAIPSTVLLDRQGRVGATVVGVVEAPMLAAQVADLLDEGTATRRIRGQAPTTISTSSESSSPAYARGQRRHNHQEVM